MDSDRCKHTSQEQRLHEETLSGTFDSCLEVVVPLGLGAFPDEREL